MTSTPRSLARFALCSALGFICASCAKQGGLPPAHPVAVQTALALKADTPLILPGFGSTTERASVDIVPQVSGTLLKIFFTDGAIVTNGQPLFLIDPTDYELRVRQGENMLVADRANRNLAKQTLGRTRKLFDQKLVSQEDFDTLLTRVDTAVAQVQSDEAALDQAKLNLARCTINAPMAGICSKHLLDTGNLAAAGLTRLTNIRSYDPITVEFSLSEQYLATIRRALQTPPVRIEVTPRGDTNSYVGTLVFLDNAVSPATGTIALRGSIDNADLKLWSNQFVDVRLFAGLEHDAIMVPEGAVQFGKMGTYLYAVTTTNYTQTVTNAPAQKAQLFGHQEAPVVYTTNIVADIASMRLVQTGVRFGGQIQIVRGVQPQERVVVLGQFILYPGATVMDVSQMPGMAQPEKK